MAFLSAQELMQLGLKSFGDNVLISDKASIYSPHLISIGSHVRIDDFCILSGEITLGSYIHIGAYCAIYGKFGVQMDDHTGLSPRCTLFSASDDFSGDYLISPMVPDEFTNVTGGLIHIQKYVQIGANTVVLPNVVIAQGVAVGAMSLVKDHLEPWGIYAGVPTQRKKERKKGCLNYIH